MELTTDVLTSIERYFNTLTNTGYLPDYKVNQLIAYIIMEEILYGPLRFFVNDKDYKSISNALNCLSGNCMIPYPDYLNSFTPVTEPTYNEYRITEEGILRSTEDNNLRVKA